MSGRRFSKRAFIGVFAITTLATTGCVQEDEGFVPDDMEVGSTRQASSAPAWDAYQSCPDAWVIRESPSPDSRDPWDINSMHGPGGEWNYTIVMEQGSNGVGCVLRDIEAQLDSLSEGGIEQIIEMVIGFIPIIGDAYGTGDAAADIVNGEVAGALTDLAFTVAQTATD